MYNSQINIRYAKSLYLIAEEKKLTEDIKKDIDSIFRLFSETPDFKTMIEHPVIKPSKKAQITNEIFSNKVNEYTLSFLQLIIKNKRENHLKNICRDFIELYRKNKGIRTAIVTTAYALTNNEKIKIQQAIENKFKATIELSHNIDEKLIGGMIIQMDDMQLDLSVVKQIQQLRKTYLNIDFNNKRK